MGWASGHIEKLRTGETVSFRPHGSSMMPKIKSGQLCTVEPVDPDTVVAGDVLLCKVRGREFLHLVSAVRAGQYQISNAHGHVNGWISAGAIFGRLLRVDP